MGQQAHLMVLDMIWTDYCSSWDCSYCRMPLSDLKSQLQISCELLDLVHKALNNMEPKYTPDIAFSSYCPIYLLKSAKNGLLVILTITSVGQAMTQDRAFSVVAPRHNCGTPSQRTLAFPPPPC